MKLPLTLSLYIGRHFLQAILLALLGLLAISALVDMLELIRRASGKDGVPFGVIVQLALLKMPSLAERLLPYAVLIGSMLALTRLTRSQELVVARAAGVSVWQFLAPAVALALMLGMFMTAVFNPIASALLLRFEYVEGKYLSGKPSLLTVSPSGLWLRQIEKDGSEHIIYATRISQSDMSFSDVTIFSFDREKRFAARLDAAQAKLEEGALAMHGIIRSEPGKPPQPIAEYRLPTTLTLGHIQDSFASPETMSFWSLPSFSTMLENAGFSGLKHRLHWQSLLASPFLLAGTVLIAALFSLRLPRQGKIGLLVATGIACGFLLHFMTDIIHALGAAGTLPVALAAWTPALAVSMTAAALLLHVEDG